VIDALIAAVHVDGNAPAITIRASITSTCPGDDQDVEHETARLRDPVGTDTALKPRGRAKAEREIEVAHLGGRIHGPLR
jgi:hypothetical protein